MKARYAVGSLLIVALCWPVAAASAPPQMSRDEIVKLAKTVVGFSYWWGGSKWLPGSSSKGKCTPNAGSGGCPKCSHSGSYGADCSGFVGKAWQVAVAKPLNVAYHPYATTHFTKNTTWWNKISRSSTKIADAFTYNTNGSGHIFLYEKGDVWGNVWAWECKGCKSGCVYNLRPASSNYGVRQRKLLKAAPPVCTAKCSGTKMIDANCKETDCSKSSGLCVKDSLGLRCISAYCTATGGAKLCLPDGKLGSCSNGKLTASGCGAGTKCVKLSASNATCAKPCPASCDDGNPCTKDGCVASTGQCSHKAQSGPSCWDGNKCLAGQTCNKGKCGGGKPAKDCDDKNPCTADSCTAKTGACTHPAAAGKCNDGDACTVGDTCKSGKCAAGPVKACEDGNSCTDDACSNGACAYVANAAACDDGDACTGADVCANEGCAGEKLQCDDGKDCTNDMCRDGKCEHPEVKAAPSPACQGADVVTLSPCGKVLDNRGPCTVGLTCEAGVCVANGLVVGADDAGRAGRGAADGINGLDGSASGRRQLVGHGGVAPSSGCSGGGGGGGPATAWLLALVALGLFGWRRRKLC